MISTVNNTIGILERARRGAQAGNPLELKLAQKQAGELNPEKLTGDIKNFGKRQQRKMGSSLELNKQQLLEVDLQERATSLGSSYGNISRRASSAVSELASALAAGDASRVQAADREITSAIADLETFRETQLRPAKLAISADTKSAVPDYRREDPPGKPVDLLLEHFYGIKPDEDEDDDVDTDYDSGSLTDTVQAKLARRKSNTEKERQRLINEAELGNDTRYKALLMLTRTGIVKGGPELEAINAQQKRTSLAAIGQRSAKENLSELTSFALSTSGRMAAKKLIGATKYLKGRAGSGGALGKIYRYARKKTDSAGLLTRLLGNAASSYVRQVVGQVRTAISAAGTAIAETRVAKAVIGRLSPAISLGNSIVGKGGALGKFAENVLGIGRNVGRAANIGGTLLRGAAPAAIAGAALGLVAGASAPGIALIAGTTAAFGATKGVYDLIVDGSDSSFNSIQKFLRENKVLGGVFGGERAAEFLKGFRADNMRLSFGRVDLTQETYKDLFARGTGGKLFSRLSTVFNGMSKGILFAGVAPLIGLAVGLNPAVAGMIGFGAGMGVQVAGDTFGNWAGKKILGNNLAFGVLSKLPFGELQSMIDGSRWAQVQSRFLLDKVGVFDSRSDLKKYKLTDLEKASFGWGNPLSTGINMLNVFNYFSSYHGFSKFLQSTFSLSENALSGGWGGFRAFVGEGWRGVVQRFSGVFQGVRNFSLANLKLGLSGLNILSKVNIAGAAGGFIGTVIGTTIATLLGLPIGTFAAIGGAVGAAAGMAIAGGLVTGSMFTGAKLFGTFGAGIGSFFGPLGTAAGFFVGALVGATVGTVAGAFVDKLVANLMPAIPNPLTLIMGAFNFFKFMTTPLRNLTDYAEIAMIAVSLVSFLTMLGNTTGGSAGSVNSDIGKQATAYLQEKPLYLAARELQYSADGKQLKLNGNSQGGYYFGGVDSVTVVANQLQIHYDKYIITLNNPGDYVFDNNKGEVTGETTSALAQVYPSSAANIIASAATTPELANGIERTHFCKLGLIACN